MVQEPLASILEVKTEQEKLSKFIILFNSSRDRGWSMSDVMTSGIAAASSCSIFNQMENRARQRKNELE